MITDRIGPAPLENKVLQLGFTDLTKPERGMELANLEELQKDLLFELGDIEWSMKEIMQGVRPRSERSGLHQRKKTTTIYLESVRERIRNLKSMKVDPEVKVVFNMVEIPFKSIWSGAMLSGDKVSTWRTRKHGEPGDRFPAFGATFELTQVIELPYATLLAECFTMEGCESPGALRRVFRQLWHGKEPQPERIGWLHVFRKLI